MPYLVDTDILIDYLRGYAPAITALEQDTHDLYLSVMNVAELYQGTRHEKECQKLASTLSAFIILPMTAEIAVLGGKFSAKYKASHDAGLVDCLIAATAHLHDLTLRTLNSKHYPMLEHIEVPYKKIYC